MDIKTFKNIAAQLPPEIAILMRGPTGVGKSHMAKALANEVKLPLVDVRGSTMDESQVSGIPDFETSKESGVATFCLPSWYVRSCREPVVLLLDELNRSMPQVMQSFFQIVLDRELGNNVDGVPLRLHPETRVIAAVNAGGEYDVNEMDPALLRRFWTIDLEPTAEDWIDWAGPAGIDPLTVDFIRQNPVHLRVDPSEAEPGHVLPTPASWHRLDESLRHMGLTPSTIAGNKPDLLYPIAQGFVGTEAAIAYVDFIENYELILSAEDILNNFKNVQSEVEAQNAEGKMALIQKLGEHCKENQWSTKQGKNLVKFADTLSDELLVHFWNVVTESREVGNIQVLHQGIGKRVVEAVRSSRNLS